VLAASARKSAAVIIGDPSREIARVRKIFERVDVEPVAVM